MNPALHLAVSNRLRATPFTSRVQAHGAKAFTVYNHMLLATEFESLEADYWHLCEHVQVWDVGVERQVSIKGPDAEKLVQWMTPRDISRIDIGRCVYAPLADEAGKVINDPVALKLADDHWWLSIADSDVLLWAKGLATGKGFNVDVSEPDVWPLAVQGPKAEALMAEVFGNDVKDIRFFRFAHLPFQGHDFLVARSGWSKQGGFEIYVDHAEKGVALYDRLFELGQAYSVRAGCPNLIERMESSLLSFGNDMTMQHSVIECGLDSFLNLNSAVNSLSLDALKAEKAKPAKRCIAGLTIPSDDSGLRAHVDTNGHLHSSDGQKLGRLGSQAWSPRYQQLLITVMLELDSVGASGNASTGNDLPVGQSIDVQMQKGHVETATIQALPFDFAAMGIEAVQSGLG